MGERTPMLKMVGVSKSFQGVKALDNVSLMEYSGAIIDITGENEEGK